ncbi:MAG: GNAT family N-acetyltransferase [Flavobacteriales bacterium]
MQIVKETQALRRQFEQQVASLPELDFFSQIWVQDVLHPKWCYMLDEQSNICLRIPNSKKWGLSAYLQPLFIRSLHVFSVAQSKALVHLLEQKMLLHLNLNLSVTHQTKTGIFQKLTWNGGISEIRNGYSENIRRNLKKAKGLEIQAISYQNFQSFFVSQKGENLGNLTSQAWQRLEKLVGVAQTKDAVFCVGAYSQGQLLAAALFFKWQGQLYFMKGTLSEAGKKVSALIFLMDAVLETYAETHKAIDFIGSNQESIAAFYRKFGAKDYHYSVVKGRIPLV